MIKKITISLFILTIMLVVFNNHLLFKAQSKEDGSVIGPSTNSPGDGSICTSCHTGPTPTSQPGWITSNIPGTGYVPDSTYTITVTGTHIGVSKFGFQATAEDAGNQKRGLLIVTNPIETQPANLGLHITHTTAGIIPSGNSKSWSFDWTAPPAGMGTITFYTAFVAGNGQFAQLGDTTYTSTLVVQEFGVSINDINRDKLQLTLFPNPVTENLNISFDLDKPARTLIEIYDLKSSKIAVLYDHHVASGSFAGNFNVADLETGVYFVRVRMNDQQYLQKIVIF